MKISVLFPYSLNLDGNNGGGANATLALLQGAASLGNSVTCFVFGDSVRQENHWSICFKWIRISDKNITIETDLFILVLFNDKRNCLKNISISRNAIKAVLYHNAVFDEGNSGLMAFYRNWPDVLFVVSEYPSKEAESLRIKPVVIIRNCVSPFFSAYGPIRRDTLGRNFLFVGALVKEKGLAYLLPAFFKLLSIFPDARLRLVGSARLWSRNETGFNKIEHPNIEYLGDMNPEKIKRLYLVSSFIVLPSEMESCGLSVLDGMWFGCIPIVSNRGGLPEIVENGKTGFVLTELSEEMLFKTMVQALEMPISNFLAYQDEINNAIKHSEWRDSAKMLENVKQKKRGIKYLYGLVAKWLINS